MTGIARGIPIGFPGPVVVGGRLELGPLPGVLPVPVGREVVVAVPVRDSKPSESTPFIGVFSTYP